MYRSDDFVVPSVEVGRYHPLAEAIRRGCKIRPKKAKSHFHTGETGACALGAAALGSGDQKRCMMYRLCKIFPELNDTVSHPFTYAVMDLAQVIFTVNDDSSYSREAIADWLCRLGGCKHKYTEPKTNQIRL